MADTPDTARVKRFYKQAAHEQTEGGWRVTLDTRPIRTAGGAPQIVPSEALAAAMVLEWSEQGEEIDPAKFIFRGLADYAIDIISPDRPAAAAGILPYAETDTLCYRAEPDDALFERQQEIWEPLLSAAEANYDLRFERVSGIIHCTQPAHTLAAYTAMLEVKDVFTLAALRTLASLSASLVIGLAALEENSDAASLWDAANLEEDWQAQLWGWDWAAEELRAIRLSEFTHAQKFVRLAASAS